MNAPRKILAPTDFSPCSKAALDVALGFAAAFDARVDVVHVVEVPRLVVPNVAVLIPGEPGQTLAQYIERKAKEQLDAVVDERGDGAPLRARLATGYPAEAIAALAREEDYDLIVIGTHGRTGMPHLLLGSVAERVVRTASCPVLTVRPHSDFKETKR